MSGIELSQVSCRFSTGWSAEERFGVHELNLEVHAGELLTLVGPSGSGKTTTLRLIAGLEQPTAGSIRIGGMDVNRVAASERGVGMLFQQSALLGQLTVLENIALSVQGRNERGWWPTLQAMRGQFSDRVRARVTQTAERLGIGHLLPRVAGELSGGEQQRVALARVWAASPRVVLLDEPFASLDPRTRWELRNEFRQWQRQNQVTCVFVTHDQAEALGLGDRVAFLDQGQVVQIGLPREIYDRPTQLRVARFFGSKPLNEWVGTWTPGPSGIGGMFRGAGWRVAWERAAPTATGAEAEVRLGIRPEQIRLLPVAVGDVERTGDERSVIAELEQIEWEGAMAFGVAGIRASGESLTPGTESSATARPRLVGQLADRAADWRIGQRLRADFSQAQPMWFDPASGRAW